MDCHITDIVFLTGYWYRNINKAKKRLEKQVLLLLDKKQKTECWWYHAQISFGQSQQTQFDIFHTKMLQNTSRCHVTGSIWILCNILENIPHALDVYAQRVLKYNCILIYDFTIIESGGFNVFLK